MKLEVIGAGSAFAKDFPNSSLLLWRDSENGILMDCGFSIFKELVDKNYAAKIRTVLLSHSHQDHCGSAVALLEYRYYLLHQETTMVGGIDWQKLLQLCEGDGHQSIVAPCDGSFSLETWLVPHAKGMECRAMLVDNCVLYSGDSAVSQLDKPQAQKAKIIVHDVSLYRNPTHVCLDDLAKAEPEIRQKTWLTHYLPEKYDELAHKAESFGFAGVAKPGMVLEIGNQ